MRNLSSWASLLLSQLSARFGQLAPELIARVNAAKEAELEHWAARILHAETLSEVFV